MAYFAFGNPLFIFAKSPRHFMRFVFTFTIFTGAFLLFLVQPMFARMLLPKLGGSSSVWNTAMVFYQGALLAGYAYAHFAIQKLGTKRQAAWHLAFICLPILVLPIGLASTLSPPQSSNPVLWVLGLMTLSVGLPFLVVSTTSPLLQRWFHATGDPQARDPYFLYAASNAGSLLALLAYPTLIEPNFSLSIQSRIWSFGYAVLLCGIFACCFVMRRETKNRDAAEDLETAANEISLDAISPARRARWIMLAFIPSSLMLSVTTYLTTDIAAVPLLWIIPLTLYLLTFILVFASRPLIPHLWALRLFPVLLLPLVILIAVESNSPLMMVMSLHLAAFFAIALAAHGELARDRPAPIFLTDFYLSMSLGGVLGGAFTALLAPLLFRSLAEYPLVLVLACLAIIPQNAKSDSLQKTLDFALPALLGAACGFLILFLEARGHTSLKYAMGVMFGLPVLVAFAFVQRPLRFGLAIGAILLATNLRVEKSETVIASVRSFFGIYNVTRVQLQSGMYHQFVHGSTLHGQQSIDPDRLQEPLTYYARSGPLGVAFSALQQKNGAEFDQIGAVGLGVGTVAAYATPSQKWTFYEIDPEVQRIAENPAYFTYLRDCRAPYEIVIGDGRLKIQAASDAQFDLLILDAYSSDSLPMHLLTREALLLYAQKLSPNGAMIFNISNRHLDLEPQLNVLAQSIGWQSLAWSDFDIDATESDNGKNISQWVILTKTKADMGHLAADKNWKSLKAQPGLAPWTDDYSSLLTAFTWK